MNAHCLTTALIAVYHAHLIREERARGTVENYLRHLRSFATWLKGTPVTKEAVSQWKEHLLSRGYSPVTINAMLSGLNGFFSFMGWADCRSRFLRVQRCLFREADRELTRQDYTRLLQAAMQQGRERLALLMETMCATGVRVSEVQYITVEAARLGRAQISLKGKIRLIFLPAKLCKKLLKYAQKQKISSGKLFLTKKGSPISRRQIWSEMKSLCRLSRVKASKVFPHNLRHLFATAFYQACRDIVKLSDLLGHSSIETTRLYLAASGAEHQKQLDRLRLIL